MNVVDAYGDSALHFAADHGNVAVCRLLVNEGMTKSALNRRAETALEVAKRKKRAEIVALLT